MYKNIKFSEYADKSELKIKDKLCSWCEQDFKPIVGNQKYCCRKCKEENDKYEDKIRRDKRQNSNFSIYHRDNFTCIYCGKSSIENKIKLNIEHILPCSLGGKTDINNLITSCFECNMQKSNSLLKEECYIRIIKELNNRNTKLSKEQLFYIKEEIEFVRKNNSRNRKT